MKTKFIPVEESFKQWKKDPKYVAAYDALGAEFALASAMIKARADADMTQEQVAGCPRSRILRPGILRPRRPHLRSHRFPFHRPYHLPLHKTTRIA